MRHSPAPIEADAELALAAIATPPALPAMLRAVPEAQTPRSSGDRHRKTTGKDGIEELLLRWHTLATQALTMKIT